MNNTITFAFSKDLDKILEYAKSEAYAKLKSDLESMPSYFGRKLTKTRRIQTGGIKFYCGQFIEDDAEAAHNMKMINYLWPLHKLKRKGHNYFLPYIHMVPNVDCEIIKKSFHCKEMRYTYIVAYFGILKKLGYHATFICE